MKFRTYEYESEKRRERVNFTPNHGRIDRFHHSRYLVLAYERVALSNGQKIARNAYSASARTRFVALLNYANVGERARWITRGQLGRENRLLIIKIAGILTHARVELSNESSCAQRRLNEANAERSK